MAARILVLSLVVLAATAGADVLFSDDFESGTLNQWAIGGRQLGVNVAEVVGRHGSLMGHLHHSEDYSEITLEKTFVYNPNLDFSFDMEVDAQSTNSSTDDNYAHGGVQFVFMNASEDVIGWVWYMSSTSSWPFDYYRPENRDEAFAVNIGDGSLSSYNLNAGEALSNLNIDYDSVVLFTFRFLAYNSGSAGTMSSDVWVDNVTISESILTNLEIIGADECAEDSQAQYKAIAHYEIGNPKDVTDLAEWSVEPNDIANVNAGVLTTEMVDLPEDVTITAQYSEGENTQEAEKDVSIFAICPSGSALDFDGVDDYVNLGNDSSLKPDLPVTLSAWVKLSVLNNGETIISLDDPAINYYGVFFQIHPDNYVHVSYGDGGPATISSRRGKTGTTSLNSGTWYHVAAVVKGATDMDLYINGYDDGGSYNGGGGSLAYSSGDSFMGSTGGSRSFYNGTIDEVVIYNRALSAEEIQGLMYIRPDTTDLSLIGYWDFDEGEGQVAGDSAGSNHGTLGSTGDIDDSDPNWVESDAPVGICTAKGLVERNLLGALDIKTEILELLNAALVKEDAAEDILKTLFDEEDKPQKRRGKGRGKRHQGTKIVNKVRSAIRYEEYAEKIINRSVRELDDALNTLGIE